MLGKQSEIKRDEITRNDSFEIKSDSDRNFTPGKSSLSLFLSNGLKIRLDVSRAVFSSIYNR